MTLTREQVRSYLETDPEAAQKVAGPWMDVFGIGRMMRLLPGCTGGKDNERVAEVYPLRGNGERYGWLGNAVLLPESPEVVRPSCQEVMDELDRLYQEAGWVLGLTR